MIPKDKIKYAEEIADILIQSASKKYPNLIKDIQDIDQTSEKSRRIQSEVEKLDLSTTVKLLHNYGVTYEAFEEVISIAKKTEAPGLKLLKDVIKNSRKNRPRTYKSNTPKSRKSYTRKSIKNNKALMTRSKSIKSKNKSIKRSPRFSVV
jgi:hypothetical protein